jgi:acyl-CoA dehydrogenase
VNFFNPKTFQGYPNDPVLTRIVRETIDFFEGQGLKALKEMDRKQHWYAEFIEFQGQHGHFATLLTPAADGDGTTRWDTWRIAMYSEVLAFYGLCYWYTWQVTILGLGPIWQSDNAHVRALTARKLREGGVFAFGLSEQAHGADIYATEMTLTPQAAGAWLANGRKYYIGNGNLAALVSTFGKLEGTGEYTFFAVGTSHEKYAFLKNVVNSQSTVAEYVLKDYPITEEDILHRGNAAWDAALNTVNIGKYNLGWASIGICEHAFYEAITHAVNRTLYGKSVTEIPHVKRLFLDAWGRLQAMRLVTMRAADYMRSATAEDRRYLLYNPIVKMKVTMQGEEVINLLWDVIAARGFDRETYFEMAAKDIRAMPKLEGTAHVNMALIVKFMAGYFLNPGELPVIPRRDDPVNDDYLFQQGPTKGLSRIQFHDWRVAYASRETPNLALFRSLVETFSCFGLEAPPTPEQMKDIDWLLTVGEIFTCVAYGQLILEGAALDGLEDDGLDLVFEILTRDVGRYAVELLGRASTTAEQAEFCRRLIVKPLPDPARSARVWEQHVLPLSGAYVMNP